MQLTKLRAAPVLQAEVPPWARRSREPRNASQLIASVLAGSRQHSYEIKKTYEEGGLEALRAKSRRVPNPKNRIAPEIEERVIAIATEFPAYGQVRGMVVLPEPYGFIAWLDLGSGTGPGGERFRRHQLRHSYSSQWLEAGESLDALQHLLGLSSVVTSQRYGRPSDQAG